MHTTVFYNSMVYNKNAVNYLRLVEYSRVIAVRLLE